MIFDPIENKKHIGSAIKIREKLKSLECVESYLRSRCQDIGIEISYDVTAFENPYFKTINYTTFAGLFIIHPLQFDLSLYQMYDAKADNKSGVGHIDFIKQNSCGGKYVLQSGGEFESNLSGKKFSKVIALPGSNKFYEHVSKAKFSQLCKRYGADLVIKPHPITKKNVIDDMKNFAGNSVVADQHENLYKLIDDAEDVYTTSISESAIISLCKGKRVHPLDPYKASKHGSFSHVNHFCFTEKSPLETIESIFASAKSGVVHPDVDADWKRKIDDYLEYIMEKRSLNFESYLEQ